MFERKKIGQLMQNDKKNCKNAILTKLPRPSLTHCWDVNLNDQKTSHFYWCISGKLETCRIPNFKNSFFILELYKFLAYLECISRNGLSFGHSDWYQSSVLNKYTQSRLTLNWQILAKWDKYLKVLSSRPIYCSILNSLCQRSQYVSIKLPLHKQSENAWVCY